MIVSLVVPVPPRATTAHDTDINRAISVRNPSGLTRIVRLRPAHRFTSTRVRDERPHTANTCGGLGNPSNARKNAV